MSDHFTDHFIDDAKAFSFLHEKLNERGYVTYIEEPGLSRPIHNSITNERYQAIFEKHFPGCYTDVHAKVAVFETGRGYLDFYVVYNRVYFKDSEALEVELRRLRILK